VERLLDILINVLLPILIGCLLYSIDVRLTIINYIPDGLWSYSIMISFILFPAFEYLQSVHFINGTGDFIDVLIYLICGLIAILSNNFFKNKFYPILYKT
jgi:hypothetical protein